MHIHARCEEYVGERETMRISNSLSVLEKEGKSEQVIECMVFNFSLSEYPHIAFFWGVLHSLGRQSSYWIFCVPVARPSNRL